MDMSKEEAAKLFKLVPPFTVNMLATAYKRMLLQEHPDHSKAKDATARLGRVLEAYKILKNSASLEVILEEEVTEDGKKLSKLGLGLGAKINGATCGDCSGRGYTTYQERAKCYHADGLPVIFRRGFHRAWCLLCDDTGFRLDKLDKKVHNTCHKCKGCGELPMWNPVLPKGLLL